MAFFQAKVPVAIATGIICLLVGGGLGAAIVSYAQSKPEQANAAPADDEGAKGGGNAKGGFGGNAKGGKGGNAKGGRGGFGGGGGGGGQRGPSPKMQLAALVGRLDTLTKQSLHIELTPEQKKQAKELLAGLESKDGLDDEEAKEKLDGLLKLVEGQRATLEAAGYRWPSGGGGGGRPGGGGGGLAPPEPNPFKARDNAERLKSLQATLSK